MNKDLESRAPLNLPPEEDRAYRDVMHCNRCGFCTSYCPTYLATGDEGLSPRGRNQAWRALFEGRLSPEAAGKPVDTCLQCGICTSVCFAQVPTGKLMTQAREKTFRGSFFRIMLRWTLPRPGLLEGLLKVVFMFRRAIPIKNPPLWMSRWFPRWAAGLGALPRPPLAFLRDLLPPAPKEAEVVHFLACGPNCLAPEVGLATQKILKVQAVTSGSANNRCCGLPSLSVGDRATARRLALANIVILEKWPEAVILIDDSSCAATVKEWPALFMEEPLWKTRAEAVARRTRDVLQWLNAHPLVFPILGIPPETVTYHDACKARFGQGLVAEPRRILAAISSVQYRELPEAEQCCGGAGAFQVFQPSLSQAVGRRKAAAVASSSAEIVLTSSVSCLMQLRSHVGVRARHLVEFVASLFPERGEQK